MIPHIEFYNSIQMAYIKGQIALLPLYFVILLVPAWMIKLEYRVRIRNMAAAASLLIPAILYILQQIPPDSMDNSAASKQALMINSAVNSVLIRPAALHVYQFSSAVTIISILVFALLFARQFYQEIRLAGGAISIRKRGRVKVVFSPKVFSPFSTGILFVNIYFPSRLREDKTSLLPILAHEAEHVRRHHLVLDLLDKLNIALGWYNPLAYLLMRKGVELREFECDKSVANRYSPELYGRILINEVESMSHAGKWALSSMFVNSSLLKRRFQMLFEKRHGKHGRLLFALSLLALLSSGILIMAFSATAEKKFTPKTITLPGYSPKAGYVLVASEMGVGKITMEEWPTDEKWSVQMHDPRLKAQLGGRNWEALDKAWGKGQEMANVGQIAFSFWPPDSNANILRMGMMIMRFTIQPDGKVSDVAVVSSAAHPGFEKAVRKAEMSIDFGPSPKGETAIVEYPLMFSEACITYPPKK